MNTESKPKLLRLNQDLAAVASADPLLLPVEHDLLVAECSRWDKLNEQLVLEAAALVFRRPDWASLDFPELTLHKTDAGWVLADSEDRQPVRIMHEDWLRLQFLTAGQRLWIKRLREQQTNGPLFDFADELFPPPAPPMLSAASKWSMLERESFMESYDLGFERALAQWVRKHRAKWRKARGGSGA